ncbi:hypothetical protein BDR26DRAFT_933597 [Obelidium mucronatum]|nr:hypothetical protein BDR26DRAFT_933597 [Obelidium mucronatum]
MQHQLQQFNQQFNGEHLNSFLEACRLYFGNNGFAEDSKKIEFITSKFTHGVRQQYDLWISERVARQRQEHSKKTVTPTGSSATGGKAATSSAVDEFLEDFLDDSFVYVQHSYDLLVRWLHHHFDDLDVIITTQHLKTLAENTKRTGYTQISEYAAAYEALVSRMTAANKPDPQNMISIFLSGCNAVHARELVRNSTVGGKRNTDWSNFRTLIHQENEVDRELIHIDAGKEGREYTNPFLNSNQPLSQPKPPTSTPSPTSTVDSVEELTRQLEALKLFVRAGGSVDGCSTVSQQAKDLFLSISQGPPAAVPQTSIAPTPSTAPFAPAPVMAQTPVPRPRVCIVCDLSREKQRELKVEEHDTQYDCPYLKEFIAKGYPIKRGMVQTSQGERLHLVQLDGSKFPFMVGKCGIRKFLMDKNAEAMKAGKGMPTTMMLNGTEAGTSEIPRDLPFSPVVYPEREELYLKVSEGNFVLSVEVLKTIGGCVIPDEEAEAALDVLMELTGSDGGDVFTCAQVIEEVMFARSEAELLAAKRSRDADEEPIAGIPIEKLRRIQPARSRAPVATPFDAAPVAPEVPKSPKPQLLPKEVQPPQPIPAPSTSASTPKRPSSPAPKQLPVPLEKVLPKKPVPKYKYGMKGPLVGIDQDEVVLKAFNKPFLGFDNFYEFLVASPPAATHLHNCLRTHRVYPKIEEAVPVPMAVDSAQADIQLIQSVLLRDGLDESTPLSVQNLLRSNAMKLAEWEGGMDHLEQISANLYKLTTIPQFGTTLGYQSLEEFQSKATSDFKARVFSMESAPPPSFSATTQYSTYASPRFHNVKFQNVFVVESVLMDKGSELNACSFDLARDASAEGAYDLSALLWMTNAGGGRNQLYGLIRDARVGLEGKLEAKQKVWICPRGEKTPFALLFGMPFIAATRATSTWDSRGNMWTKLTSQDGKLSVQYQTVSYSSARNIVEPQKKPNAEGDDLMILPWAGGL